MATDEPRSSADERAPLCFRGGKHDTLAIVRGVPSLVRRHAPALALASVLPLACKGPRDPTPIVEPPAEPPVVEPEGPGVVVRVVAIAVGGVNVCAILEGGRLRCWGSGLTGLNGYWGSEHIGDDETPASAGDLDIGEPVVQVSMSNEVACAVLESGDVRCWGKRWTVDGDSPVEGTWPIDLGSPATQISIDSVGCALLETKDVRCWGYASSGKLGVPEIYGVIPVLGDDERVDSVPPLDMGGPVVAIGGTCALLELGSIRCWGDFREHQVGWPHPTASCDQCSSHEWCCVGDDESPKTFGDLPLGARATALANDGDCAIIEGGRVRCWGFGPDIGDRPWGEEPIVQVSGSCGLSSSGLVRCAGYRPSIPGNDDPPEPSEFPVIELGHPAIAIAADGGPRCALLETGTVRCWGNSDFGQLGYASRDIVGDDETPASMGDVDIAGVLERGRQPEPPDAELLARLERAGVTLTELPSRAEDGTLRHHAKVELDGRALADVAAMLTEVETLRSLDVSGNGLQDIDALSRLTRVEALDLSNNPFDSVFALRLMKRLRRLDLHETNVNDIGVLAGAAWLEWLDLSGIPVNVADLVKIHELPLLWLDVRETKIYGDADHAELKELFPDAQIQHE